MLWFLSQKQINFVVEKSLGQKVYKLTEKFEPDREKNWRGNWRLSIHNTKTGIFFSQKHFVYNYRFSTNNQLEVFSPFFNLVLASKSRKKTLRNCSQNQKPHLQIENKTYCGHIKGPLYFLITGN